MKCHGHAGLGGQVPEIPVVCVVYFPPSHWTSNRRLEARTHALHVGQGCTEQLAPPINSDSGQKWPRISSALVLHCKSGATGIFCHGRRLVLEHGRLASPG